MYPMQNYPCYPAQMPYANPSTNPSANAQVNAVKIDIHEPKAYGGVNSDGQANPAIPANYGPYNYPYAPMYNMPTVGQYVTPNAYPQPPIQACVPQCIPTCVPQAQQPIINPIQPNQQIANVMPAMQPQVPQIPQSNFAIPVAPITPVAPAVIPAPIVNSAVPPVPAVPAPAAAPTSAQPTINAPVTQQVTVNSQPVPTPAVDVKQTTTDANNTKAVEPVKAVEPKAPEVNIDVNGIISALSSTNTDEQTAAIQRIAELAQTNPVAAKGLLNDQVFDKLVNIINADTSKLEGPKGAPDPKNLSPLEKAEINKQFAVYTLAILQKNFREEINQLMKKNNLPDIAINDIPFIKEGIVNNLKDNPNPTIREACLSALNYIGRPEDKEVLKVLYDISAKHDSSPAVKATAQDYLSKLPA